MKDPFFYCHPDNNKSCGACCGLYNYEGFDRETVTAALEFRTGLYNSIRPSGGELEEFRALVADVDSRPKLLEEIYTCEFLGFVDERKKLVGCLIHPLISDGTDLRDCAYYGAETCGEHRCTAYNYLAEAEALPVIAALDDWYLYGQCITDIDLVKGFYEAVSDIRGQTIKPEKIPENAAALDAFREYLELKETWPYRRGRKRFGQYVFESGSFRLSDIDYESLGAKRPREARILRSLGSEFNDGGEFAEALSIVRRLFEEVAESI